MQLKKCNAWKGGSNEIRRAKFKSNIIVNGKDNIRALLFNEHYCEWAVGNIIMLNCRFVAVVVAVLPSCGNFRVTIVVTLSEGGKLSVRSRLPSVWKDR